MYENITKNNHIDLSVVFSFKQMDKSNDIDKYIIYIDKCFNSKKLVKKDLDRMSIPGGAVSGYYLEKKLVLIRTIYGAEFGCTAYKFYLKNDSLVFINESKEFLKVPEDSIKYVEFESYMKSHTDKKGNTNLSKWPLETYDDNSYYLSNNTIVDFKLKSFKKPKKAFEDEIREKNKELIYRFTTHIAELK